MNPRTGIRTAAAALLVLALAACGACARSTSGAPPPSTQSDARAASAVEAPAIAQAPCGPTAPEVLATAAGSVAKRIYAGEIAGSETQRDKRQVEQFTPLLAAMASGKRAAVTAAVRSLVFSHTHVVRLRVSRRGNVLADIGGPYILAPVGGSLRFHGRTVGRYVLSVQDDLGYVKLETRFIGAPLVLRTGSNTVPVGGVLANAPASIPDLGPVVYRSTRYEAVSFNVNAFPTGTLRISLLLGIPNTLYSNTCAQIRSRELGRVAQRISRRFPLAPSNFAAYLTVARGLTDGLIYLRAGSRQLAGSPRPGPPQLPREGFIRYGHTTYGVSSFSAPTSVGRVRVYVLVKP